MGQGQLWISFFIKTNWSCLTNSGNLSLKRILWVVRRVELSLRSDKLDFNHHALVAPFEPKEQKEWLDKAEAND